jgi:hypothetical protein
MRKSFLHSYTADKLLSEDIVHFSSIQQLRVAVDKIIVFFKRIVVFNELCDSIGYTFDTTIYLKNIKQMAPDGTTAHAITIIDLTQEWKHVDISGIETTTPPPMSHPVTHKEKTNSYRKLRVNKEKQYRA